MKIAHIAPPWMAIPPKNYGGTENVLSYLVEEQVAQGHDVTVFAPGDAKTSARLVSFFPRSLIGDGIPWQGHLKGYYHLYKAVEYIKDHDFDRVQEWKGDADDFYMEWASQVSMILISEHARTRNRFPLKIAGVIHHGVPMAHFQPGVKQTA